MGRTDRTDGTDRHDRAAQQRAAEQVARQAQRASRQARWGWARELLGRLGGTLGAGSVVVSLVAVLLLVAAARAQALPSLPSVTLPPALHFAEAGDLAGAPTDTPTLVPIPTETPIPPPTPLPTSTPVTTGMGGWDRQPWPSCAPGVSACDSGGGALTLSVTPAGPWASGEAVTLTLQVSPAAAGVHVQVNLQEAGGRATFGNSAEATDASGRYSESLTLGACPPGGGSDLVQARDERGDWALVTVSCA